MKVSPSFSKAAGCRGRALARAPQSAELSCAYLSAGGGLRGNPRRGFPLIFLHFVRVRRSLGQKSPLPTARSTPFLCSCAKKRGGAPKKRAYGCRHGRCWVPPASPTDSKPQHHSRLRQADLSARSTHRVQTNLTHQFVPLGLRAEWERRAGPPR